MEIAGLKIIQIAVIAIIALLVVIGYQYWQARKA